MKLAISNIAWESSNDEIVYCLMQKYGYSGLEIAPTRVFLQKPYENLREAAQWSYRIQKNYGFGIPSMQSIWYGRQESIFGSAEERRSLLEYTKRAIEFAEVVGCGNLVFGCPRNRNLPDGADAASSIAFFRELGDYAIQHHTVIGMEANPTIYHTNFINETSAAMDLIERVDSAGFKLNLDVGTMIQNGELVDILHGKAAFIRHVHISEPGLRTIEKRQLHKELSCFLTQEHYQGYISIEMGKQEEVTQIERIMDYVRTVFEEN